MTFLIRHTLAWPTWAVSGVPRRYVSVFPWTLNSDGLASVTFTCFSSLSYVGHTQESGSSCSFKARSSWPCFFPSVPGTVLCWGTVRLKIPFSSAVNQAQKKMQKITLKYFCWQLFGMILIIIQWTLKEETCAVLWNTDLLEWKGLLISFFKPSLPNTVLYDENLQLTVSKVIKSHIDTILYSNENQYGFLDFYGLTLKTSGEQRDGCPVTCYVNNQSILGDPHWRNILRF